MNAASPFTHQRFHGPSQNRRAGGALIDHKCRQVQFLMIALHGTYVVTLVARGFSKFDKVGRLRAAIDQFSQDHDLEHVRTMAGKLVFEKTDHRDNKIEQAVDIAQRISAPQVPC